MSFYKKISFVLVTSLLFTQTYASFFFGKSKEEQKPALAVWHKEAEIEKILTATQTNQQQTIMLENEWKELLCDEILNKLNRTVTSFGTWGLRKSLQPIADKDALLAQQQRVRALVDNEELYVTIKNALTIIKDTEDALLTYHNSANILHRDAKGCYYSETLVPSFNKSKLALDLSFTSEVAKYAVLALVGIGAASYVAKLHAPHHEKIRRGQDYIDNIAGYKAGYAISTTDNAAFQAYEAEQWDILNAPMPQESLLENIKDAIVSPVLSHMPFVWRFKDMILRKAVRQNPNNYENSNQNSLGDMVLLYKEGFGYPELGAWAVNLLRLGFQDMHIAMVGQVVYSQLKSVFTVPSDLKIEMVKIARLFDSLEHAAKTISDIGAFKNYEVIDHVNKLFDANDTTLSESLHRIITELKLIGHDTESSVYSRGRILLLHKLLQEVKTDLVAFMQDIAQIDALFSVATLYKEGAAEHPWSYVTFVDEKHPTIEASSFWLPLVHTDHVVLNSIKMGGAAQGKVILTGPNGGGKSTIMKAMAYQIIFAQSWGIVPSHETRISVFTALRTALNPQEDMKRGLSTFMAQKQRMDQITAFIRNATAQDIYFVLVDEPYRGTVEIESQKRVMGFANDVALYDQIMLMMATHFEKPTQLAQTLPAYYANYQCEFIKTADGLLERTYRLLPGAALWWFHDEAMRGLYIDCLECAGQITA